MDVDKKEIFDKIKTLVDAYNEANQYDRQDGLEVVGNGLNMTYEGRRLYLLRQIFSYFVIANGQEINDGVILSLVESSTLTRHKDFRLTFDSEKQKLSYTVPDKPNRRFELSFDDEIGRVILRNYDRRGDITCSLENGNSIVGFTKIGDVSYKFVTKFQDSGLLDEFYYKRALYPKISSYAQSFFGNIQDISLEHHSKLDGNTIVAKDNLMSGGQNIQQDFRQNGISEVSSLIKPLIPGFGQLAAREHGTFMFDEILEEAFPELCDIAKQYYSKIEDTRVAKK